MNYEKDVQIDESALDVEWLEQAALAAKYGRHWAECKKNVALAEEKIKIVRAELIQEANDDPAKYCGKDKPNAADIEAYYRNHKKHKDAKQEWIQLQYELDMVEVARSEISFTRKAALESLVRLYVAGYFAGPRVPRDLSEEVKARQQRIDSKITIRRRRQ